MTPGLSGSEADRPPSDARRCPTEKLPLYIRPCTRACGHIGFSIIARTVSSLGWFLKYCLKTPLSRRNDFFLNLLNDSFSPPLKCVLTRLKSSPERPMKFISWKCFYLDSPNTFTQSPSHQLPRTVIWLSLSWGDRASVLPDDARAVWGKVSSPAGRGRHELQENLGKDKIGSEPLGAPNRWCFLRSSATCVPRQQSKSTVSHGKK